MKPLLVSLSLLFLVSCMKGKKVDLIFHNASILCLNYQNSTGEAIAIKNGKIVEIGPERQILNKYRAEEIIDVEGKEIVPTFSIGNFHLDSFLTIEKLKEIELKNLEQGITEIYVNEINESQLNRLISFIPSMELEWHINLSPNKSTIDFIRKYKKPKNKHFNIQGFSIGNDNNQLVKEAIAIAKDKNLQIGINFSLAEKNIPYLIQSLKDYKQDHRWFVYEINEKNSSLLKQLEVNNFFQCVNQFTKTSTPLYQFNIIDTPENLFVQLNNFSKKNKIDYLKSLKSISNWSTYMTFSETTKGSLVKGKEANFTILETPLSTSLSKENIYSNSTFIQGKKIYSME